MKYSLTSSVLFIKSAVIPLIEDRSVLYREAVSGTYSRLTYGLGQLIADIPFHMVNTIIMYAIIYYMVGKCHHQVSSN